MSPATAALVETLGNSAKLRPGHGDGEQKDFLDRLRETAQETDGLRQLLVAAMNGNAVAPELDGLNRALSALQRETRALQDQVYLVARAREMFDTARESAIEDLA